MKKIMVLLVISSSIAFANDPNSNIEIAQLKNDPQLGPAFSTLFNRVMEIQQEITTLGGENPCANVSSMNLMDQITCQGKQARVAGLQVEMGKLIAQIMALNISSSLKEQISAMIQSAIERARRGAQQEYYYTSAPF